VQSDRSVLRHWVKSLQLTGDKDVTPLLKQLDLARIQSLYTLRTLARDAAPLPLQHTAAHCNKPLQHTATRSNPLAGDVKGLGVLHKLVSCLSLTPPAAAANALCRLKQGVAQVDADHARFGEAAAHSLRVVLGVAHDAGVCVCVLCVRACVCGVGCVCVCVCVQIYLWMSLANDCNTVRCTAIHYNTLKHTATHCNPLQRVIQGACA